MTANVSLQKLSKTFDQFKALESISLEIDAGEFIVLLGPSGCGKSTLLSIIGGFLNATSGKVLVGGKDMTSIPPSSRPTTTMFQDYALFPHMTLRDNVGFGLRMKGMGRKNRARKADQFLEMVGLKSSATRKPHELSGGQRQRVALARALAVGPDILLLDEPLGALDMKLRREMQDELKAIQREVGTTFIHVTHDQEEAMAIADRIVVMNGGVIEDCGRPSDIYMRPRSLFSAGFMGEVNFIPGRVIRVEGQLCVVETEFGAVSLSPSNFTAGPPSSGQKLTLCLRPEQLRPTSDKQSRNRLCRASVVDGVFFGTHFRCHLQPLDAPPFTLVAHMAQSSSVRPGDTIDVLFDAADIIALPCQRQELPDAK